MNSCLKMVLVLFLFGVTGCANYYYLKGQQKTETDKPYQYHKLLLTYDEGKQQLGFYTYADYVSNRIEKEYIFFKNPEMSRLLRDKVPQKHSGQLLFIYTNQPVYANIVGFYYKGLAVADIKAGFPEMKTRQTEKQLVSRYAFGKFQVYDFYKNVDGGLIRFVAINNPEADDPDYKKFDREIYWMFFEANTEIWDKTLAP